VAFWSGMGIPISIAGGMVILWAWGGTLNMMSLFAFVMILGIVVDDAIVVGEAIYVHRKNGDSRLKAAVNGTAEVGLPVTAAVLTTVVAFFPLMNVGGVLGKFIAVLPIVVIGCLGTSLVECLTLLPAHLNHLPGPEDEDTDAGKRGRISLFFARLNNVQKYTAAKMERFVEKVYMPFLEKSLTWRYISLCIAIAVFMITIGLIRGGIIRYNMMPDMDGTTLRATIQFPDGTPQPITKAAVEKMQAALDRINERTETSSGKPLLIHTVASVGQSRGGGSGSHVGAVEAILIPAEERGIHSSDISFQWEKEVGGIPGVETLTFSATSFGRPGSPIEIKVQGSDMDILLAAADDLAEKLKEYDGVYQVQTDFSPGKNEMRLSLKPEARGYGLTVSDLGQQIQAGYHGSEAVRILRGDDDIRVKVRYTEEERMAFSSLDNFRIRTADGHELPLKSVADITYAPGYSSITRTDGLRGVTVSSKLDYKTANASEIIAGLSESYFPSLKLKYPGLVISVEGDQKHNKETFGSLAVGFPLALVGIFIIMATIFRSYVQPFIIMFTVPFGIIGAIFGHLVMGCDLAMMSAFGMVALTGVVVNDAIVLIDRINRNLADGMPFFEAVKMGGVRRFRAVFLTTVSTVGGLLPLILETDLQAQMLIPMAVSIAFGVLFATLLTLVLIPALFSIMNDIRMLLFKLKNGAWPTREGVEPATQIDAEMLEDAAEMSK
jgi:multidrug efflux pump subunit AcrB